MRSSDHLEIQYILVAVWMEPLHSNSHLAEIPYALRAIPFQRSRYSQVAVLAIQCMPYGCSKGTNAIQ